MQAYRRDRGRRIALPSVPRRLRDSSRQRLTPVRTKETRHEQAESRTLGGGAAGDRCPERHGRGLRRGRRRRGGRGGHDSRRDDRRHTGRDDGVARRGRGPGQPDRLGRVRRGREHGPEGRLGDGLREGNRLPGQRQDGQYLGRDGDADAHRRVRRRLGLRRRQPAPDRGGRRRAREPRTDPELRERVRGPEEPAAQHRRRHLLRRAARPWGEPAPVPHGCGRARARLVGGRLGQGGSLQGQGDGVRQPDLHRRRCRLPEGDAAGPRDRGSVRARPEAVRRGGGAVEAAAEEHRRVLVGLHEADRGLHGRRERRRNDLAGDHERARGREGARRGRPAEGRVDRLVGHVDDLVQGKEPELHVHVDEPHHLAEGERGRDRVLR